MKFKVHENLKNTDLVMKILKVGLHPSLSRDIQLRIQSEN